MNTCTCLSHLRPGKSAVKALLSPEYKKLKGVPNVENETNAQAVLTAVNAFTFFLRVQRGEPTGNSSSSPKVVQIIKEQKFAPEEYYAWFYDGSQWTTYAGGVLMIVLLLAGVMFPLWPPTMRLGVWYLSIGMLGLIGLFFVIAIVRLIFYIITIIVASPGIWIFPQLFADVGFVRRVHLHCSAHLAQVESFIPLWEWDLPKKKSKKKGKKEKKDKSKAVEQVEDSADSQSRTKIEEVLDEDD